MLPVQKQKTDPFGMSNILHLNYYVTVAAASPNENDIRLLVITRFHPALLHHRRYN